MVSIIIPTYNDTKEINNIISTCKQIPFENEIIVIDDGSSIEHKKILKSITGIKLITHKRNKGKARSMLDGFNASQGDIIAFIDADLIGLTKKDIVELIKPVATGKYEITISEKGAGLSKYGKYIGIAATFTGERVFKRAILEKNKDIFNTNGYTIEAEMNRRFLGKRKIARVSWPNVSNPSKIQKRSVNGVKADIKMYNDIKKKIGLKELSRQLELANSLPILNGTGEKNVYKITKNIKNVISKIDTKIGLTRVKED